MKLILTLRMMFQDIIVARTWSWIGSWCEGCFDLRSLATWSSKNIQQGVKLAMLQVLDKWDVLLFMFTQV